MVMFPQSLLIIDPAINPLGISLAFWTWVGGEEMEKNNQIKQRMN